MMMMMMMMIWCRDCWPNCSSCYCRIHILMGHSEELQWILIMVIIFLVYPVFTQFIVWYVICLLFVLLNDWCNRNCPLGANKLETWTWTWSIFLLKLVWSLRQLSAWTTKCSATTTLNHMMSQWLIKTVQHITWIELPSVDDSCLWWGQPPPPTHTLSHHKTPVLSLAPAIGCWR